VVDWLKEMANTQRQ